MALDEKELVALVRSSLDYDAATGAFTWASTTNNRVKPGDEAGTVNSAGYRRIMVGGVRYSAHRLAWLHVFGRWPDGQIDHINRMRDDNRIVNLRECTAAENGQNRSRNRNNSSGFTGVCFSKIERKWIAYIKSEGRRVHLGYFANAADANNAYVSAKRHLHTFNPMVAA